MLHMFPRREWHGNGDHGKSEGNTAAYQDRSNGNGTVVGGEEQNILSLPLYRVIFSLLFIDLGLTEWHIF